MVAVTSRQDVPADMVVRQLGGGGYPCDLHRIDPADIDSGYVRLSADLASGGCRFTVTDRYRTTRSEQIHAIWWRKPTTTTRDEGHAQLEGVLRTLAGVRWINHPDAIVRAAHKPTQLLMAHRAGMLTPAVCLPSALDDAHRFADARLAGAIAKTWAIKGPVRWVTPQWRERLACEPVVLQERVDKQYDVRVTAVGDLLFAASVHVPEGVTDWRSMQEKADYRRIDVPPETAQGMWTYLRLQGLTYGAFDFAVDRDGLWWFLECNPNGQWGFVELKTGLPIARALASALSAPAAMAQTALTPSGGDPR
ncbi:hypothetical protein ACFZB5_13315 [Streptomyces nodosus]|uniref:hypothetical protein n=1 Tax=Streptomyces nodosus TaxID=40318 RepID=UPI0036E7BE93